MDPLQQEALAEPANNVPNARNATAARPNTVAVIFVIFNLLIKMFRVTSTHTDGAEALPHQKAAIWLFLNQEYSNAQEQTR